MTDPKLVPSIGPADRAPNVPTIEPGLSSVTEHARDAGAQVAAAAGEVVEDVQNRVGALAGEAKDRMASAGESYKTEVAEGLEDVADALHQSKSRLDGQHDWIAQLVDRGADELGKLATTLRTNDLQGLFQALDDMAKRQPAVFVGAAMAAGFATVRIGKVAISGASRADLPKTPELHREPG